MQCLHHRLELCHLVAHIASRTVAPMRSKISERVVSPVILQPLLYQAAVVYEGMDRHQLHRRHSKPLQVAKARRRGKSGVGAAQRLRHIRILNAETAYMRLVNNGVGEWCAQRPVLLPVKVGIHHNTFRNSRRAVPFVNVQIGIVAAEHIRENGLRPIDAARYCLRIRIDQQLRWIEALSFLRLPWSMHAISISLPRLNPWQITMPHKGGDFRQCNFFYLFAVLVEEAKFNTCSLLRVDGKIYACSVPLGAQRVRLAWK